MREELFLFAYGSLLRGEMHHGQIVDCIRLGPARTQVGYRLVDLGQFPALIEGGAMAVVGELYAISKEDRFRLDVLKENGRVFQRKTIQLESGQQAEAYLMSEDKLRGRPRLRVEDWRQRFAPSPSSSRRRF